MPDARGVSTPSPRAPPAVGSDTCDRRRRGPGARVSRSPQSPYGDDYGIVGAAAVLQKVEALKATSGGYLTAAGGMRAPRRRSRGGSGSVSRGESAVEQLRRAADLVYYGGRIPGRRMVPQCGQGVLCSPCGGRGGEVGVYADAAPTSSPTGTACPSPQGSSCRRLEARPRPAASSFDVLPIPSVGAEPAPRVATPVPSLAELFPHHRPRPLSLSACVGLPRETPYAASGVHARAAPCAINTNDGVKSSVSAPTEGLEVLSKLTTSVASCEAPVPAPPQTPQAHPSAPTTGVTASILTDDLISIPSTCSVHSSSHTPRDRVATALTFGEPMPTPATPTPAPPSHAAPPRDLEGDVVDALQRLVARSARGGGNAFPASIEQLLRCSQQELTPCDVGVHSGPACSERSAGDSSSDPPARECGSTLRSGVSTDVPTAYVAAQSHSSTNALPSAVAEAPAPPIHLQERPPGTASSSPQASPLFTQEWSHSAARSSSTPAPLGAQEWSHSSAVEVKPPVVLEEQAWAHSASYRASALDVVLEGAVWAHAQPVAVPVLEGCEWSHSSASRPLPTLIEQAWAHHVAVEGKPPLREHSWVRHMPAAVRPILTAAAWSHAVAPTVRELRDAGVTACPEASTTAAQTERPALAAIAVQASREVCATSSQTTVATFREAAVEAAPQTAAAAGQTDAAVLEEAACQAAPEATWGTTQTEASQHADVGSQWECAVRHADAQTAPPPHLRHSACQWDVLTASADVQTDASLRQDQGAQAGVACAATATMTDREVPRATATAACQAAAAVAPGGAQTDVVSVGTGAGRPCHDRWCSPPPPPSVRTALCVSPSEGAAGDGEKGAGMQIIETLVNHITGSQPTAPAKHVDADATATPLTRRPPAGGLSTARAGGPAGGPAKPPPARYVTKLVNAAPRPAMPRFWATPGDEVSAALACVRAREDDAAGAGAPVVPDGTASEASSARSATVVPPPPSPPRVDPPYRALRWSTSASRGATISADGRLGEGSGRDGHILIGGTGCGMHGRGVSEWTIRLRLQAADNTDVLVGVTSVPSGPTYFYRGDGCKIADDGTGGQHGSRYGPALPAGVVEITCELDHSGRTVAFALSSGPARVAFVVPAKLQGSLVPMVVLGRPGDSAEIVRGRIAPGEEL